MKEDIERRAVEIGQYFIETECTVREAAVAFGVSKSTVHRSLVRVLPEVDGALAKQAKEQLKYNGSVRSERGGEATKVKWQNVR